MATVEITAYADQSAYVAEDSPGTNYSTGTTLSMSRTSGQIKYAYVHYNIPQNARKKKISIIRFNFYLYGTVLCQFLDQNFNEKTVTYSNRPYDGNNLSDYNDFRVDGSTTTQWRSSDYEDPTGIHQTKRITLIEYGLAMSARSGQTSIDSSRSSRKPYITMYCDDVIPVPENLYPQAGYVDRTKTNIFGWTFAYDKTGVIDTLMQKSAAYKWRVKGSTTEHTVQVMGAANTVNVPANTFPAGSVIEWCVQVTSNDDIASAWSDWCEVTTVDAMPDKPTLLSPDGSYLENSQDIPLTWQHNVSTGSVQSGFDIQYSTNAGAAWTLLADHEISERSTYTVPAKTLPTGTILWRVRTYNSDGTAGEWADPATIILVGPPDKPSITTIEQGKARPMIRWISADQEGAQVVVFRNEAVIYDSGVIFGTAKEFRVPVYLENGTYQIRVRVQNQFEQWSSYAEATHTIATNTTFTVQLTGIKIKNGIRLTFETIDDGGA